MAYRMIHQDEINSLWIGVQTVRQSKQKAIDLLRSVSTYFEAADLVEYGLKIFSSDTPELIATIETPFGKGRARIGFSVVEAEVMTNLVFDREILDEKGRPSFQVVFVINLPRFESPFVGTNEPKNRLAIDSNLPHKVNEAHFAIGVTLIYAILNGPMKSVT